MATTGRNTKPAEKRDLTTEELRAQSVLRAKQFIEVVDVAEEYGKIGAWIIPEKHRDKRDWHFVRMHRGRPMHRELAHQFHQQGYVFCYDHLRGVRCVGFETDGDNGNLKGDGGNAMYMCCPPETWMYLQEQKRKAQTLAASTVKDSFGATVNDLRERLGTDNVSVEQRNIPV